MIARTLDYTKAIQIHIDVTAGHCVDSCKEKACPLASDVIRTCYPTVLPHQNSSFDALEACGTYKQCAGDRFRSHIPTSDYPPPARLPR